MMRIDNPRVKNFIKENKNLIENDEWEEFYKIADRVSGITIRYSDIGQMTEIFLGANINPLESMNYIPERFLSARPITKFEIPNHIKKIENYAFSGCVGLTNIIIPDSVTSIGYSAFYNCSSLTNMVFKGTKEDWSSIRKGEDWNYNVPAKEVHCSDGDVNL